MVQFADTSSSPPDVPGWTKRAVRRRYLPYTYEPLAPPPEGRCTLRAGASPPPISNGSERVVIYRNQAWGPLVGRDKRWYLDDADAEQVDDLIKELMAGDDESFLARAPEYWDAEDHKLYCQVTFRLFAKGPIVERFEALTLLDRKADGGFFIGETGPYYIDFPDRDRKAVLRLEELPPQLGEEYLAYLLREAGFCVLSVEREPNFRGMTRDNVMLATLRLAPGVAPPKEFELCLEGHNIVLPVVCISNRSIAVETPRPEEYIGTALSEGSGEGLRVTVSFPDDEADVSDAPEPSSDTSTSDSREGIPPAFVAPRHPAVVSGLAQC